ncbi:YidC/Oxa1 family membrane protein insertase [Dehalococcoidia bacterium]|nr:YidC/Oxa1 family membrane protein insertase [Dehalococcoidia bacterium]MCL0075423.1 YidC/Oxa1 family membrane protein insertase [Dehalococcoidia bacterium]
MIELWNVVLLQPIINGLLIMSHAFGNSFGLAIIVLTIIINVALLPLTLRQTRSTIAMQSVQPKRKELQAKYGKDKVKLQQETMKLYKEAGINPLGCIFPLLIQFPVWIALYQSLMHALATTPERLLALSQRLYAWSAVQQAVPPERHFLWMDLSQPDRALTILIVASMWLTQRMTTMPSTDPKQQQMNKMMQWMMPLMMGFIFLNFPSGLALYIVVMNVFRMAVQYFVMGGWGGLATLLPARVPFGNQKAKGWTPPGKGWTPSDKTVKEIETTARKSMITTTAGEGTKDGSSRSKRKNRRRSRRTRS